MSFILTPIDTTGDAVLICKNRINFLASGSPKAIWLYHYFGIMKKLRLPEQVCFHFTFTRRHKQIYRFKAVFPRLVACNFLIILLFAWKASAYLDRQLLSLSVSSNILCSFSQLLHGTEHEFKYYITDSSPCRISNLNEK